MKTKAMVSTVGGALFALAAVLVVPTLVQADQARVVVYHPGSVFADGAVDKDTLLPLILSTPPTQEQIDQFKAIQYRRLVYDTDLDVFTQAHDNIWACGKAVQQVCAAIGTNGVKAQCYTRCEGLCQSGNPVIVKRVVDAP